MSITTVTMADFLLTEYLKAVEENDSFMAQYWGYQLDDELAELQSIQKEQQHIDTLYNDIWGDSDA